LGLCIGAGGADTECTVKGGLGLVGAKVAAWSPPFTDIGTSILRLSRRRQRAQGS
jgi:hypothetical protein